MRELTILHTSDLLIGSNIDSVPKFGHMIDDLARRELPGRIDYVVISGNLTFDGSDTNFLRATDLLQDLFARDLFRPDDRVPWTRRLLIVPGPRDVESTNGLAAFQRFHDRLFGPDEAFDGSKAIVRDLKDLTFIGLAYSTALGVSGLNNRLNEVRNVLADARERVVKLEYTRRTPTILVSADSIVYDGDPRSLASFRAVQTDLDEYFRTTLHLYGASHSPSALPSPIGFKHVGFGAGWRSTEGFWPCTLNLVSVRRDALEEEAGPDAAPFLSARLFQVPTDGDALVDRPWIHGHLDSFYKREAIKAATDNFYKPALEKLETELILGSNTLAFIGFPGSGKKNLFDYLSGRKTLVQRKVHVVPMTLNRYDEFPAKLQGALDRLRTDPPDADAIPLLLIHDTWFAKLSIAEKSELVTTLDANDPHRAYPGLCVVLLLTAADFTFDKKIKVLTLPPMDQAAVPSWVREYSRFVPVEERHLRNLAGGYAGFSERLLKGARAWFEERPGPEPMHRETPATIMEHALGAPIVAEESQWHRENLQLLTGGEEVYQYIAVRIQEIKAREGLARFADLPSVRIKASGLEAQYTGDRRKTRVVRKALEHLVQWGVLSRDDDQTDEFTVCLLAPFRNANGFLEAQSEVLWPDVTDEDLLQDADVVIIAPCPDERDAVLSKLPNARSVPPLKQKGRLYWLAKVPTSTGGVYRVAVMTLRGQGQVQATLGAKDAILRWNPDAVFLVGIAGGVQENGVSLGDVLVADTIAYYAMQKARETRTDTHWDMGRVDAGFYEAALSFSIDGSLDLITEARPGTGKPRLHFGPVVSGDVVVARKKMVRAFMKTVPKLVGIEMEAWGVLSAVEHNEAFFMVRGVSDYADAKKDDFWRAYARDAAASYAISLLQRDPLMKGAGIA
jgi:nucleoside phosphorylase